MITLQELPPTFKPKMDEPDFSFNGSLDDSVRKFERDFILRALENNDNNKEKTADTLRVGLSTLYRKLKELDIKI
jgi:transcriptional regulator with PAS, ATPase and Fis domain